MLFRQRLNLPRLKGGSGRLYLSLLCALSLSACQTVFVDTPETQAIVPLEWPQELSYQSSGGTAPHQLAWWDFFNDPVLNKVIHESLVYNRDLQMAVLRVAEAEAILQLRRSDLWPTVGVDGQATRARMSGDLSPTFNSQTSGEYDLMVGVNSWELDLWGRIRHLKDAALEEFLAGSYARHAVQAALVADVARMYLSLQTIDDRIDIAQKSIVSRQESYRIFKRRYEVGASSLLDLTQVETLLMQAQVLESQLQQERTDIAHALAILVGKPVSIYTSEQISLASQYRADTAFEPIAVGLPSEVLLQRPDIVEAEHRIKASESNINAARAAYFPRIALTAGGGTASAQLDGLFDGGSGAWVFSPTVALPIFDGGARAANVRAAEVRAQMAIVDYEKVIQQAFREVSDALSHRKHLREQVSLGQRVVQIQQQRAYLAQLRYDSGAVSYLDVLDAQRELLTAQQQLAQDQGSLSVSYVDLYNALGGGTQTPGVESQQQIVTN